MPIETTCRDLLLAVVQDAPAPARLRSLADKIDDWNRVIDIALQHRVLPMLFRRMADLGPPVPTSAIQRMRREYERIVVHNVSNAAELTAVLQQFESEGIEALPFKGVVLAASTYGDLLKRPGGDLDLLIREVDFSRASEIILQRGFEPKSPDRDVALTIPGLYERTFLRPSDGTILELRWRLSMISNRYSRNLGLEWAWPYRRLASFSGVAVPDLSPEPLLLVLCMHGSKHSWSRLIWVCDIAKILGTSSELDWTWILAEARKLGLNRCVALGVLLANRLINAPVPHEVLMGFEADKTASRLADYFVYHLLESPGKRPPGRFPYGWQLLDRQDRMNLLLSWEFLKPSQRDRQVFALPKQLSPLYYLLRPIRLLLDRSAR